jgi:putative transposase
LHSTLKGSNNRTKAARRLGTPYRKASNQRADALRRVTTKLAKTKSVIVIEDPHVFDMLRNHHLAQAISEVGFGEFRRQLLYEAAWYGSQVVVVSRWEPSSKTCSACGWVDEDLDVSDRVFRCQSAGCGQVLDRDLSAAVTVRTLAGSSPEGLNACREASACRGREAAVKLTSVEQEPNTLCASA